MTTKTKQPKGMYILAFTEIFERFSYYTLSFLLVLYASAPLYGGGLGWSNEKALGLVGIYTMTAYTLPILGSFIADRFIGKGKSVILGGCIIILGHFFMLFSKNESIFYLALFCVALGTSFFKPCMPSLLGDLYKANDTRRESGFSWYYFGINIGAMIAGVSSGLLTQKFGYQVALSSAGVGMVIGMVVFILGKKHLVLEFDRKSKKVVDPNKKPISKVQMKALYSLIIAFVFFALWTTVYNIAISGTLTLYIEKFTNKTVFNVDIPTTFFMSLESLTIILFTPIITFVLTKLATKNKYPHFFTQMNLAVFIAAASVFYFTYLAHIGHGIEEGVKPFQYYQFILFIVLLSISETIISPVMMSAISIMAPLKYKSLFQAFYLATFGLTGLLAAKIGALSLKSPFETFLIVSIVILVGAIVYYFVKPKMIKTANEAAKEQLKQQGSLK
ncbi:MFS transporter [Silvanigrella paludirubra]|uniref:MFS transporter n=1 Tax=Silvanigrella paludirubra TaxID=2499159 RepID=A0A6N6VUB9_9BACT|nr:peptide MFS transporter [Silvanigrella paludirubra]KAB8036482.1 MFS transporter [Silvanigrella paludirubra]